MAIDFTKEILCPYCGAKNTIDFKDFCESSSVYERPMGPEIIYDFDTDDLACEICKKEFRVKGQISEYPEGAFNHEDFQITPKP